MNNLIVSEKRLWPAVLTAYYFTLAAFLAASFFPQFRLWGLNHWAYFPDFVPIVLFTVGALLPLMVYLPAQRSSSWNFSAVTILAVMVMAGIFYFTRDRTHFEGDGYQALSLLAQDSPVVKFTNFGETLIHRAVYSLIGGSGSSSALLTYQTLSCLSGFALCIYMAYAARCLFDGTRDRALFLLGLISGGYMLLFCGHVENYSLFVASVGVFALTGLMVTSGCFKKWLILPPLLLSIFFHVFGVSLVPAAGYLLVSDTGVWRRMTHGGRSFKIILASMVAAMSAGLFWYFYNVSHFFRFALVPLWKNHFTVDGYTLFAPKHLVDIVNLIVLLLPALPLILVVVLLSPDRKLLRRVEYIFLFILLLSSLVVVTIFNPRLGMPRDWDLFSFVGIPLVVGGFYVLVKNGHRIKRYTAVVTMAIVLGFLSLVPRAIGQTRVEIATSRAFDSAALDLKRNIFMLLQMHDYFWERGDYELSPLLHFDWETNFPEWGLVQTGLELRGKGRTGEAMAVFRRAIEHNPLMASAYLNLGSCHLFEGRHDSAIANLKIAEGLNRYDPLIRRDLGYAYLAKREFDKAETSFNKSLAIDPDDMQTFAGQLRLYELSGRHKDYLDLLYQLASRADAPYFVFKRLGDYYIGRGLYENAAVQYKTAIARGMPEKEVQQIRRKYPQMRL